MSPALLDANHNECDDGTKDEQANDGHASVDLPPPDSTCENSIILAVLFVQLGRAIVPLNIVGWSSRLDGNECGKHPS